MIDYRKKGIKTGIALRLSERENFPFTLYGFHISHTLVCGYL